MLQAPQDFQGDRDTRVPWGEGLGLDLEGKHGLGSEQGETVSRGQSEDGAGDVTGTVSGPTRNQLLELG